MDWSIFGNFENITFESQGHWNVHDSETSIEDSLVDGSHDMVQEREEEAEMDPPSSGNVDSCHDYNEKFAEMQVDDEGNPKLKVAWENAVASIGLSKSASELQRDDIVGREWETLDAAEYFFKLYARVTGFSVRKGHIKKRQNGEVKHREWLCSRQGKREDKYLKKMDRKRQAKPITRVGCKVSFRVSQNMDLGNWVAVEFQPKHCHELTDPNHVLFLRSNRMIEPGSLELARSLRNAGMRTCHIMSYMAQQAGGYDRITHTIKDLYNIIGQFDSVDLADADAAKAIGYLEHKCAHDKSFFGKYSYDQHFRLKNLVWADGRCKSDYGQYGHAIAFDTTYKTNSYGKPLLVWIGINRHFRTTIMGFALLFDETIATYKWVTEAFLECMKGVRPVTVVTDGDLAIRAAILEHMPETEHRLCGWHIHQNALANVKKHGFHPQLQKLIYHYYSEDIFQEKWDSMVRDFKLEGDEWVEGLYEKRESWAESFKRGKFFAWMSTTQRNEGINSALKKKLRKAVKLSELVKRLDMALSSFRFQEADDNFKTLNSVPVTGGTNMVEIEDHAAQVYTRAMFYRVRVEIVKEGKYKVSSHHEISGRILFRLKRYGESGIKTRVLYSAEDDSYTCECQIYPSKGIPCRHIFACLKAIGIKKIPISLIWKQWTMYSWKSTQDAEGYAPHCLHTCSEESARFAHIHTRATDLAYYATKSEALFTRADELMNAACTELRNEWDENRIPTEKENHKLHKDHVFLRNPLMTKCKGTSSTKGRRGRGNRKCSQCKMSGHNKTTCSRFTTGKDKLTNPPHSNRTNEDEEIIFEDSDDICESDQRHECDPTSSANSIELDMDTSSENDDFQSFADN